MSNQIVIIDNVAFVILVCLFSLSNCVLNELIKINVTKNQSSNYQLDNRIQNQIQNQTKSNRQTKLALFSLNNSTNSNGWQSHQNQNQFNQKVDQFLKANQTDNVLSKIKRHPFYSTESNKSDYKIENSKIQTNTINSYLTTFNENLNHLILTTPSYGYSSSSSSNLSIKSTSNSILNGSSSKYSTFEPIDETSTPINLINRTKRSTTARLNFKTSKFKTNSHNPSSTTTSAKIHLNQNNQFILNQKSLTNDLNNAEITYSLPFTTEFVTTLNNRFTNSPLNRFKTTVSLMTDNFLSDRPFVDSKRVSLSKNRFKPNISSNNLKKNDDFTFPNDFYTSKSYDLYSDKLISMTSIKNHKMGNIFENTATSLLPLLLFDRHQLAQEEELSKNIDILSINSSTVSPLKSTLKSESYTNNLYSLHDNWKDGSSFTLSYLPKTYTTFNHNFKHNKTKKKNDLIDTSSELHAFKGQQFTNRHFKHKNEQNFPNDSMMFKLNNESNRSSDHKLPKTMSTIWPILDKIKLTSDDENQMNDNQFSLINLETNSDNQTDLIKLDHLNKDLNVDNSYNSMINDETDNFNKLTTTSLQSNDKATEDENELFTNLDIIQPSNFQTDRHHSKIGLLSLNYVDLNVSRMNESTNFNNSTNASILSPAIQNVVIILLGLVIIITIIGNTLVCLSPIYFRKLRHPSNYLLISLALSDLGVALLVMPIALYKELHLVWSLGDLICDIWLGLDVVCCTASILHLCVICIDRYLTITRPFTYAVRRKSSRSMFLIAIVWLLAIGICLPPLLVLGNEHGTQEEPKCDYCGIFGYQLYATLGAFYIPLLVMLILYYKIYEAAKKVIEAEHKSQCNSLVQVNTTTSISKSTDNREYSSHIKKVNVACSNSLMFTDDSQLACEGLNNTKKSIDYPSSFKNSKSEKSSSTNCISCGRSLEKVRLQTITNSSFNKNEINENCTKTTNSDTIDFKIDDKVSSKETSKHCTNNELNKTKPRKYLFTIRKSKSNENNALSIDGDLNFENDDNYQNKLNNDKNESNKMRQCVDKKNKRLKKKSRTPDNNNKQIKDRPLLESTRKKERNNLKSLSNLEFLDQIDQSNLCEQCLDNLILNRTNNDNNNDNNNNKDESIDNLNQPDQQLVLECNTEHNVDQLNREPKSLNWKKTDTNYDNKFDHQFNLKLDQTDYKIDFKTDHKSSISTTHDKKTAEQKLKNRSINLNIAQQQITSCDPPSSKKLAQSSLRERKASITLGVIMCAFIFCWLPFFILALLRPFVAELIPEWASSLTLWLGYLNSMLNPLIYVTFHQDFRRAFKYILLCRCKVMKSSMRKEAYNVQYG